MSIERKGNWPWVEQFTDDCDEKGLARPLEKSKLRVRSICQNWPVSLVRPCKCTASAVRSLEVSKSLGKPPYLNWRSSWDLWIEGRGILITCIVVCLFMRIKERGTYTLHNAFFTWRCT